MLYLENSKSVLGGVLSPSYTHETTRQLGYTPDQFNEYGWIIVEKDEIWLSNALCSDLESLYKLIDKCLSKGFTVKIPSTTINLKVFISLEQVELGVWDNNGVYTISANDYPKSQHHD